MTRASDVAEKKPYHPPKLIVYGDLTQLTMATGSMKGNIDHVKPTNRT
jgi:hypothetical protein